MTQSAFIVLGMHRSGTSALTRSLEAFGLEQANDLLEANEFNRQGYFEARPVVELNDELLERQARHWADPKPFDLPGIATVSDWAGQAAKVLRTLFALKRSPLVKDPRISRTLPVWTEAFATLGHTGKLVILCRNPLSVAASLYRRDGMGFAHALDLWFAYMMEAVRLSRGHDRALVHYETLVADPQGALERLGSALGLAIDGKAGDAAGAIVSADQHHRSDADRLFDHPTAGDHIKRLYAVLSEDGLGDEAAIETLWQDWLDLWEHRGTDRSAGSDLHLSLPDHHASEARSSMARGDVAGAVAACRRALEGGEHLARIQLLAGQTFAGAGLVDEAELAWDAARRQST
ncbi:hypothetical protein GCM10011367_21070 [Marinicauda pacifica]|uniref:Sulfotransferase family protein n=1 Tax=Marinicauda pacifica TaxID=1133559 RepID=A0A4S2H950_9PROT|nr:MULTISPECIES: sulfotransferase [Marinicauda]TGY92111.1 hypothetical protein E5162_10610 [Marinicauda pacifica]GGE46046.1 hypothetical protein GCM10011367_21070 [Marinicauda pacifica]